VKLLADSSIWVDHIRQPNALLAQALRRRAILIHPLVIGEVAMGSIASRAAVLANLTELPKAVRADDFEVLDFVERHRLFGTGLGLIDAHLLASTLLTPRAALWTRDRRLRAAAARLDIAGEPAG